MSKHRPSRDEREKRAASDTRSDVVEVLTTKNGAANGGYSYHIPTNEGKPLCNASSKTAEFECVTVEEAKRRNKQPCRMCERIAEK